MSLREGQKMTVIPAASVWVRLQLNRSMRCSARVRLLALCLIPFAALAKDRVAAARENVKAPVKALFDAAKVSYPPDELYLRAFKKEKALEVWAGAKNKPLVLIKTYAICAASGEAGPKREEGDLQVPEGFYEVKSFNPVSNFHLSMEVSYPNASDRVLGTKGKLGGAIYLHGNCVSIGCIAIEDPNIEEVYVMASEVKSHRVPFHIFPARLTDEALESLPDPHRPFWKQLQPGYLQFEASRRPPSVKIDQKTGAYEVKDQGGNLKR